MTRPRNIQIEQKPAEIIQRYCFTQHNIGMVSLMSQWIASVEHINDGQSLHLINQCDKIMWPHLCM